MTNLGYSSVDQYLYALKATVQKLQDANQALRAELLKYSENADAAHDEQPRWNYAMPQKMQKCWRRADRTRTHQPVSWERA